MEMTFNEKRLEEFSKYFNKVDEKSGIIFTESGAIMHHTGGTQLDCIREFIEQALIDKEQDTLKRVHGCLPRYDIIDDGYNVICKIEINLEKEFKQ